MKTLDENVHRLRRGDRVKLTIRDAKRVNEGLAPNPFRRGYDTVRVDFGDRSAKKYVGERLWVEITEDENTVNGYIVGEPARLDEQEDGESADPFPRPEREEAIEWEGTGQSRSDDEASRRNGVFSDEDVRGDRNDLIS